jgi:diguanylate cyclase (GGDEF)-like protein
MDPTTVVIILSVNLTFTGGLYYLIGRNLGPRSGIGLWAAASIMFGLAYCGRLAAGLWASGPLLLAFDTAMFAAALCFLGGLRQFVGVGANDGRGVLLVALAVYLGLLAFVLRLWGEQGRYVLLNAALGSVWLALAVAAGRAALGTAERVLRTPLRLVAIVVGVLGLLTLLRSATIARDGLASMFKTLQAQVYYGYASLAVSMLAMTMLWMVFVRLHGQLAELATRDTLTGLLNRRGLGEAATRHFALRDARPITLLQLDVDHFKRINDGHGHGAGDAVLRAVAAALASHVRGDDFVARVGGEEFVVGCASSDRTTATLLGERLRGAVAELSVEVPGCAGVRCTVSVGMSRAFARLPDLESAWREADLALYAAKSAGRNRVEVFGAAGAAA